MNTAKRIADWLETHWVTPAYSGWLLSGLTLFFFVSATNTLSGWLYVISGVSFALLAIAAILPERTLRGLRVERRAIDPVTVGEPLLIELILHNGMAQAKSLLQVRDRLPHVLGNPVTTAIERVPARRTYRWVYSQPTRRRGIYRWQTVDLRTAAPLGLFWCRRSQMVNAVAVVYPTVLPLAQCPLVDAMGQDVSLQFNSERRTHTANEEMTRSLRPYRWGDPIRLVHWRTSARHGELRVRELDVFTGGQALIICLDNASSWARSLDADAAPERFEQAVVAAATLYFYARRQNLDVKLWTAGTGVVQGNQLVLETLAAVQDQETVRRDRPSVPLIWLTQDSASLEHLPVGSRWLLWPPTPSALTWEASAESVPQAMAHAGLLIQPDQPLSQQLQQPLQQ